MVSLLVYQNNTSFLPKSFMRLSFKMSDLPFKSFERAEKTFSFLPHLVVYQWLHLIYRYVIKVVPLKANDHWSNFRF